jgi:hypothetical protein
LSGSFNFKLIQVVCKQNTHSRPKEGLEWSTLALFYDNACSRQLSRFQNVHLPLGVKCPHLKNGESRTLTRVEEIIMTERLWTSRDALCSNFPLLAFAPALLCALTIIAMPSMQAQTMHTLHVFTGGGDGSQPFAGVTLDRDGNLYGTTNDPNSDGGVYELVRQGSDWIFKPLYNFQPQNDGQHPIAPVAFGPDGALYGTTALGGYNHDGTPAWCGTVYGTPRQNLARALFVS